MSDFEVLHECPNCLSPLELQEDEELARCPVCQFAARRCPECSGQMIKRVVAPDGVGIEADGLPLEQCQTFWTCQASACNHEMEAEL